MKKFSHLTFSSLLIISVWWIGLSGLANYIVRRFGVSPTFPYYHLIIEQAHPTQAVWAHFDGTHYLKLAEHGYVDVGTQAFFPVYPLLIRTFHLTGLSYFAAGQLISLISLVLSLICLHYLFGKCARIIIGVLLLFPTSFFLGAVYTESLFLLETLLFFLLLKQQKFFLAALIAAIASGTRLVGALLAVSLFVSIWPMLKSRKLYLLLLPIALTGLLSYMYFLWSRFHDPLAFIHVQSMFGAGRSSGEIFLLPQVFYRYFKIFLTVSPLTLVFGRAVLELAVFLAGLYYLWRVKFKIPVAVLVYLLGSLLLPTFSGSLSSLPRYALILLPWLISSAAKFNAKTTLYLSLSFTGLLLLFSLFVRGQFVA